MARSSDRSRMADRGIIVLEAGQIADQSTHEELRDRQGTLSRAVHDAGRAGLSLTPKRDDAARTDAVRENRLAGVHWRRDDAGRDTASPFGATARHERQRGARKLPSPRLRDRRDRRATRARYR